MDEEDAASLVVSLVNSSAMYNTDDGVDKIWFQLSPQR